MSDPVRPPLDLVGYFTQNRAISFHHTLVADAVRTTAFQRAIERVVKPGDTVIDLGAGSGVLSLFACRAGARRVYAIEHNGESIAIARRAAKANGFARKIRFIEDDSRMLTLPEKADVLVSECIGWMMYGGSMIAAVTDARDRMVKTPHVGRVIPRQLSLYVAPVESPECHEYLQHFAQPRYGLELGALRPEHNVYLATLDEPALLGEPTLVETADLETGHPNEMLDSSIELVVSRPGALHGLALWFDCDLCDGVRFSTAPGQPVTVWRQTFLNTGDAIAVTRGTRLRVRLRLTRALFVDRADIDSLSWDIAIVDGAKVTRRAFSTRRSFDGLPAIAELDPRMAGEDWNELKHQQVLRRRRSARPAKAPIALALASSTRPARRRR